VGLVSNVHIIGYNPSVSTTASTVWSGGATSYVQLTSGTALEVVSASANDTAAGTGARTVVVDGLDASYVPFSETVTLNGVTPVALTNTSAVAINRTYVATAGSGLVNAGKIDVRAVSGAAVKSSIQSLAESSGRSADFVYTVPASCYGLLRKIQFYARTNTGDIWIYLKTFNSAGVGLVRAVGQHSLDVTGFSSGEIVMDFGDTGWRIPEKTLITLTVDVSAGTPLASAIGELDLYLA
jgi:hypothetical protein